MGRFTEAEILSIWGLTLALILVGLVTSELIVKFPSNCGISLISQPLFTLKLFLFTVFCGYLLPVQISSFPRHQTDYSQGQCTSSV